MAFREDYGTMSDREICTEPTGPANPRWGAQQQGELYVTLATDADTFLAQ